VTEPPTPPTHETRLALSLPPDQESGVYASFAQIWHDSDGFILDFAVPTMPPVPHEEEATGDRFLLAPAKVVSRVRIPASQAWEFMRALNEQLAQWEQEHGEGSRPPTS
jgi:hypothetical protein